MLTKRKKTAFPMRFSDDEKRIVFNAAAGGLSLKDTALLLGIHEDTLNKHSGIGRDLHEAMEEGRAEFQNKVIGVFRDKIIEDKDTTCILFYLKTQLGWKEASRKEIDIKADIRLGPLLQSLDEVQLKDAIGALEAKFEESGKGHKDV